MGYNEVLSMLEKLNLPVAYWEFDEDNPPDLPYVVFTMPDSNNVYADGKVYYVGQKLYVELYVGCKNQELEEKIQKLFGDYGLGWSRKEYRIEDKKIFEELYELEV